MINEPIRSFVDVTGTPRPAPPAAASLGFALHSVDDGVAEGSFDARSEFANIMGFVQGGYLAAMLDTMFGAALLAALPADQVAPTLELKVSYLRPMPVAGRVHGRGRVLHRGSTIAFLAAELIDPDGNVAVTGSATARIVTARAQPAASTDPPAVEGADRAM